MNLALAIIGLTLLAFLFVAACAFVVSGRFARMEEEARREQIEKEKRQAMAKQFAKDVLDQYRRSEGGGK